MLLSRGQWPDARVEKEAIALGEQGYKIQVLAWDRESLRKSAFQGNGFIVEWMQTPSLRRGSILFGLPFFMAKMVCLGSKMRADIVHAHDLDTLLQGVIISKLTGARLVYDSHEIYSSMVEMDVPKRVAGGLDRLESTLVRGCDLVLVANQPVAEHFRGRTSAPIIVVMNAMEIGKVIPGQSGKHGDLRLFYGGSLEPKRYILELLDFVKGDRRLYLRIAGSGRYEENVVRASKECARIQFLGYISQERIVEETLNSDIVFSMLDSTNKNYRIATPVKLLEAMALGRPIIVSRGTLAGDIVEREGCGISTSWSEPEVRSTIESLLDPEIRTKMGARGLEAARREYNWGAMRARLLEAYRSL